MPKSYLTWLPALLVAACAGTVPERPAPVVRPAARVISPQPSFDVIRPTASLPPFLPTPLPGEKTPTPRPTSTPKPAASAPTLTAACADGTATDGACGVEMDEGDDAKGIYLATNGIGTRTFTFEVSGDNITERKVVSLGVLTRDRPALVAVVGPASKLQAWHYRWSYKEARGDYRAQPDGTLYRLPWPAGQAFRVAQGWNGSFSHQGIQALDFTMPIGTPVLAARGGLVVATFDQATDNTTNLALMDTIPVNQVLIEHDDGTLGAYLHLDHLGARVQPGDRVQTGQQIGVSGNTGFSSGPHLHFECRGIDEALRKRTYPVLFQTSAGSKTGVQPLEGQTYTAF